MTTIYTIGHGNRPVDELVGMLKGGAIACLVDVRAWPASRRHPQFARDALALSLERAGIRYAWEGKALGGRRRPAANSIHTALRSASFRAYADHMATAEFRSGIERLAVLAGNDRVAVMCAERLPWECHRYLISDYLVARGETVTHLINESSAREHRLNPIVRLRDGQLVYDGGTQDELKL